MDFQDVTYWKSAKDTGESSFYKAMRYLPHKKGRLNKKFARNCVLSAERGLNTETKQFKASRGVDGSPMEKLLVSVNMRGSFARGMVTVLGYGIQTWSGGALSYVYDYLHTFSLAN